MAPGAARRSAVLAMLCGLLALGWLAWAAGGAAVWDSARGIGWGGFAAVVAMHAGLMGVMGAAWRLVAGEGRWRHFAWGRAVRDSAAELLPLSQLGGYVMGARAAALAGVPGVLAAASTVVDVTAELVAQLGYTAFGLALLEALRPGSGFALPVAAALVAMAGLAAAFALAQARGVGAAERVVQRVLGFGGASQVQARIRALHARHGALALACLVHAAAWLLNGVETWLTLRLMAVRLGLAEGLVIDSLLYGLRSVAFLVPSALGVQEGGLIVLCGLFGVGADTALALSLVKRARDVAIGAPALLAWQGWEGRRAWR